MELIEGKVYHLTSALHIDQTLPSEMSLEPGSAVKILQIEGAYAFIEGILASEDAPFVVRYQDLVTALTVPLPHHSHD